MQTQLSESSACDMKPSTNRTQIQADIRKWDKADELKSDSEIHRGRSTVMDRYFNWLWMWQPESEHYKNQEHNKPGIHHCNQSEVLAFHLIWTLLMKLNPVQETVTRRTRQAATKAPFMLEGGRTDSQMKLLFLLQRPHRSAAHCCSTGSCPTEEDGEDVGRWRACRGSRGGPEGAGPDLVPRDTSATDVERWKLSRLVPGPGSTTVSHIASGVLVCMFLDLALNVPRQHYRHEPWQRFWLYIFCLMRFFTMKMSK